MGELLENSTTQAALEAVRHGDLVTARSLFEGQLLAGPSIRSVEIERTARLGLAAVAAEAGELSKLFAHYMRGLALCAQGESPTEHDAWLCEQAGQLCRGNGDDARWLSGAVRLYALGLELYEQQDRLEPAALCARALIELGSAGAPVPVGLFDVREQIGRGGTGRVYRAIHLPSGRDVALKIVPGAGERGHAHDSFLGEVRSAAGLDHPNITVVLDFGQVDHAASFVNDAFSQADAWIALELAEGGTLTHRFGRLDWWDIRKTVLALLHALAHAHARGVVHRDVKGGNILYAEANHVGLKLSDFGLATAVTELGKVTVAGTPTYMAPEQFLGAGRHFGPWTDLYGVGCLMMALVQGTPPFMSTSISALKQAHLNSDPPALVPMVSVPVGVEKWIRRCIEKSPADRFQRAAHAAHALMALGPPIASPPAPTPKSEPEAASGPATVIFEPSDDQDFALGERSFEAERPKLPDDWRSGASGQRFSLSHTGLALCELRNASLIGRHREQDQLWQCLLDVVRGGGANAVVISGESGAGATRLMHWVAERADEVAGVHIISARHGAMQQSEDGLRAAFSRFLRCERLSPSRRREQIARRLAALGVRDVAAELDTVLWGDSIRPRHRDVVVASVLGQLGKSAPVVLCVDDAQYASEMTRLVRHIIVQGDASPILAVATANASELNRDDGDDLRWLRDRGAHIALAPLDTASCRQLVDSVMSLEPALAIDLAKRTRGNPQFVVQTLFDWVRRDCLVRSADGLALKEGEAQYLPDDLHAAWAARIDAVLLRLPPRNRMALELAAVLGVEVDQEEWHAACTHLDIRPSRLVLRRLLAGRLAEGDSTSWAFTQGMVRQSLLRGARDAGRLAAAHSAAADALVDSGPGRRGRHLFEAGRFEEAAGPLVEASVRRRRSGRSDEAVALVALADRALDGLGVPARHARRVRGWIVLASVYGDRYQSEKQYTIGIDAAALTRDDGGAAHGHSLKAAGCGALGLGRYAEAEDLLLDAATLFEGLDSPRDCGNCWEQIYDVRVRSGRLDDALMAVGRSRDWFTAAGDARGIASAHESAGALDMKLGNYAAAEVHFNEVVRILEGLGERRRLVWGLNHVAEAQRMQGRLDEAEQGYRRLLALCLAIGHGDALVARFNLAIVEIARGRAEAARRWADEALLDCVRLGRGDMIGLGHLIVSATLQATDGAKVWGHHFERHREAWQGRDVFFGDAIVLADGAANRATALGHTDVGDGWRVVAERQRAGVSGISPLE